MLRKTTQGEAIPLPPRGEDGPSAAAGDSHCPAPPVSPSEKQAFLPGGLRMPGGSQAMGARAASLMRPEAAQASDRAMIPGSSPISRT